MTWIYNDDLFCKHTERLLLVKTANNILATIIQIKEISYGYKQSKIPINELYCIIITISQSYKEVTSCKKDNSIQPTIFQIEKTYRSEHVNDQ